MLAPLLTQPAPQPVVAPLPLRLVPLLTCPLPRYRPRKSPAQAYDARKRVLTYGGVSYGNVSGPQYKQFQQAPSRAAFVFRFLRRKRRT